MDFSLEAAHQTEQRLRNLITSVAIEFYPTPFRFINFILADKAVSFTDFAQNAIAIVQDAGVWSALVPTTAEADGALSLFSLHFPPNIDHSGMGGWLASSIKRKTGSGVMIVCGYNPHRGGQYAYWATPWSLREQIEAHVEFLRLGGARFPAA